MTESIQSDVSTGMYPRYWISRAKRKRVDIHALTGSSLAKGSSPMVAETASDILHKTTNVWRRVLFEKRRTFFQRLMFVRQLYSLAFSVRQFIDLAGSLDFDLRSEQQELRKCVETMVPLRSTFFRVLDDMENNGLAAERFERKAFLRLCEVNELLEDQEEAWRLALNGAFRGLVEFAVKRLPPETNAVIDSADRSASVSINTDSPTFKRLLANAHKGAAGKTDDLDHTLKLIQQNYTASANATAIPGFARTLWKYRCGNTHVPDEGRIGFRIIAHYEKSTRTLSAILFYPKDGSQGVSARGIVETVQALSSTLKQI